MCWALSSDKTQITQPVSLCLNTSDADEAAAALSFMHMVFSCNTLHAILILNASFLQADVRRSSAAVIQSRIILLCVISGQYSTASISCVIGTTGKPEANHQPDQTDERSLLVSVEG